MASADWVNVVSTNAGYSLVDTLGLDMDQNYCWNIRSTGTNSVFATRNIKDVLCTSASVALNDPSLLEPKVNDNGHTNFKLRALMKKRQDEAHPFLFLRANGKTSSSLAYKFVHRLDGKFALYKETIDGNFTTTPLLVSSSVYTTSATYEIEFLTYSQPNNDTFIEAWLGDRDPYTPFVPIFKTMIFGSDNPILSGWCGFGSYSSISGTHSYFDLFEVYEEQLI